MKRILITGKNSYIGMAIKSWLEQNYKGYSIELISVRDSSWKNKSFTGYSTIVHTAAIVHQNEKKIEWELFKKVNCDLPQEIALKARNEGVLQFIYISSMSVYGKKIGAINKNTLPCPDTKYGRSKLEGESSLQNLQQDNFRVSIIRPPMIYGKRCRGNYFLLSRIAQKICIFPSIENKRSALFIDNLCEFIRLLIEKNISGIFYPQNDTYICTSELVERIAMLHGNRVHLTGLFNKIIIVGLNKKIFYHNIVCKAFGSLYYDREMSAYKGAIGNYQVCTFEESLLRTELEE